MKVSKQLEDALNEVSREEGGASARQNLVSLLESPAFRRGECQQSNHGSGVQGVEMLGEIKT